MESKLITVNELASQLCISRSWIYQQVERNKIPHYRIGRAVRFDLSVIQDWLAEQTYEAPVHR